MADKTVLIIDDEVDLIKALTIRLEGAGYNVAEAYDGLQGLNMARKMMPDLIILDLMLPKINGFRVSRFLKFDESYKSIPIIMLTAKSDESDKVTGMEVGADQYITKPFDNQHLLDAIGRLLES